MADVEARRDGVAPTNDRSQPADTVPGSDRAAALASLQGARLVLIVVLVDLLALGAAAMARAWLPRSTQEVPLDAWSSFFSVTGVLYAIVIGFLLASLLTRFHRLSSEIRHELNAIETVRDVLVLIAQNEETKFEIVTALSEYVDVVVDEEWPLMISKEVATSDTSPEIYRVMVATEKLEVHDDTDVAAIGIIITKLTEMTSHRTERLEMSHEHLSPALRALVIFLSLVVVTGFLLANVGDAWIHGFMVVAVTTAVQLLVIGLVDLNQPFVGLWNISDTPFRRAGRRMKAFVRLTTRDGEEPST